MSAFGGAEVSLGPSPGAVSTVDFHRAAFVSRQRHPGVFLECHLDKNKNGFFGA